jgi:uncharacterized protein with PIN domain
MENPNTTNAKTPKSSGNQTLTKCIECNKELTKSNLARHMRRVHKKEVKGSEACPNIGFPNN